MKPLSRQQHTALWREEASCPGWILPYSPLSFSSCSLPCLLIYHLAVQALTAWHIWNENSSLLNCFLQLLHSHLDFLCGPVLFSTPPGPKAAEVALGMDRGCPVLGVQCGVGMGGLRSHSILTLNDAHGNFGAVCVMTIREYQYSCGPCPADF